MTAALVLVLSIAPASRADEPQVSIAYAESSQPLAATESVVRKPFVPEINMPAPTLNFLGQGVTNSPTTIVASRADVSGAVGPNHYVQTVNNAIEIWNKSGVVVLASTALKTLWAGYVGTNAGNGCATSSDLGGFVMYDQLADRWLVTKASYPHFDTGPNFQCVAVSKTGDPTGTYWLYDFSFPFRNESGRFAMWPDAYYATYNIFNGSTFFTGDSCAYDRNSMLNGSPATQICFGDAASDLRPVTLDGPIQPPRGSPGLILGYDVATNALRLKRFIADFSPSGISSITTTSIFVTSPTSVACATNCVQQPTGGALLPSNSPALMSQPTYRNFGTHESILAFHTVQGNTTSGVRWYEVRAPYLTPSIFQSGTHAPDNTKWRWIPSLAQDQAEGIAAGYSLSSTATNPSIAWAGRLVSDPAGTLGQPESVITTGTGVATSSLWGLFSSMTVDPSDDCTFWYTNYVFASDGSSTWDTHVAKVKFVNCAANDFSIAVSPTSRSVSPGARVHFDINTTATAGSPEMIDLSVQDLPPGVSGSFFPNPIAAGSTTRLTVNAAGGPALGVTTFTVIGKTASAVHAANAALTVVNTPPPAAPANLSATATSGTQVSVIWGSVVGADSYDVYRRGADEPFTFIANRTSPSFTDNSVTAGNSYLYLTRALGVGGESASSIVDVATTIMFAEDPLVPGTTVIKATHLAQILSGINALHSLSDHTIFIVPQPDVEANHVTFCRNALNSGRSNLSLPALSYAHTVAIGTLITALDFQELRNGVK